MDGLAEQRELVDHLRRKEHRLLVLERDECVPATGARLLQADGFQRADLSK